MASTKRTHIFISYKRVEPDVSVARAVFEALSQHHNGFIDQIIPVGVRWGELIEAEIHQASFLGVSHLLHEALSIRRFGISPSTLQSL
jgi:hypothetical protein